MTDEQINEAVREALGLCMHRGRRMLIDYIWAPGHIIKIEGCAECSGLLDIPDIVNDPRLFWPLAEELLKNDLCLSWWRDGYVVATSGEGCVGAELGKDKEIGRAVCLAYLTLHKGKDNIKEDAV